MTTPTQRVPFYEASCRHCRRTFSIPLLGDQGYGQFIFHGEKGSVFGFLFALEEPAWADIENTLRRAGLYTTSYSRPGAGRFQRVVAASADPIGGQPLVLLPVCPGCRSRSVEYGDSKPLDIREIRRVTFDAYQSLSDQDKTGRLRQLWEECA